MDLVIEKSPQGWHAHFGEQSFRCAVGRSNLISADHKREGDGATPIGRWRMCRVLFRPDRIEKIETPLPTSSISPEDGWCDEPSDTRYNQQVVTPYPASHEILWREDHVYDIIVVLDHNTAPAVPGLGSAIFLHVARDDYEPTEGCVALAQPDLLKVLREATSETAVKVLPP